MSKLITSAVIAFILRQIAKFGAATDWAKVKVDAAARVAKIVHIPAVAAVVDGLVNNAIDAVAVALQDKNDLQSIADSLVAGDFNGALAALEALLIHSVHPGAPAALEGLMAIA